MPDALEKDVREKYIHSAYRRLNMRDHLDRSQPLGGGTLRRPDGSFVHDQRERSHIQKEYFTKLLNCRREIHPSVPQHVSVNAQELPDMAHMPTLEEVETAIRKLKNNKAAGVCKILLEMLKYGGQCVTNMLHRVISRVWQTGKAPADWKKSLLVPILKKGTPR